MFLEKLELVELSNWHNWDKIISLSGKKKAKWESGTVIGTFIMLCVLYCEKVRYAKCYEYTFKRKKTEEIKTF